HQVTIRSKGELDGEVAGNLMSPVEARERPFRIEILVVLRDDWGSGSEGRSVVGGLGERIGEASADTARLAFAKDDRAGIHEGMPSGVFPDESLDIRNERTQRTAVGRAQNVEGGSLW